MPSKKTKEFILTNENYYDEDRPHVSNSMISTYLKSPALYEGRYITKTVERIKTTNPMKKGLIVDHILTQPDEFPFERKTLKKDDPEAYERQKDMNDRFLAPPAIYDEATEIAQGFIEQPFWQDGLEEAQFQLVLEGTIDDVLVCGLPDRVDRTGEQHWRITDVKVVAPRKMQSPAAWYRNAKEMGYLRQAAMYRQLFADMQGVPVENVTFTFAVGSRPDKGFVDIRLFDVPPHLMDMAMLEIREALDGIKKKRFQKKLLTWKDSVYISAPDAPGVLKD